MLKPLMHRIFLLVLATLLLPFVTNAKDSETSIYLGGAFAYLPEYAGSNENELRVLPLIGFDDIGGFELSGLALSYPLIDVGTGQGPGLWSLKAGARGAFDFGRDSADSPTLTGLEDIGPSLLAGGFVRATYGPLGIRVDAGQDVIGGHEGFVADFSVGTFLPDGLIADGLTVQPALTLSWADQQYNQATYGITAQQVLSSILPQYDLGSGFHQASASLLSWYDIDDRWRLNTILSYREYIGDYRDSPIIQAPDGAASNIVAVIGISRRFGL